MNRIKTLRSIAWLIHRDWDEALISLRRTSHNPSPNAGFNVSGELQALQVGTLRPETLGSHHLKELFSVSQQTQGFQRVEVGAFLPLLRTCTGLLINAEFKSDFKSSLSGVLEVKALRLFESERETLRRRRQPGSRILVTEGNYRVKSKASG